MSEDRIHKILSADSDTKYAMQSFIEKTVKQAPLYPDSYISPWNPDDIVQKQNDYGLYEDMLKDDQVSVCLQLKKDTVLCSGFDIVPQEDDQEEIIEDIQVALTEDPDWSFEEMLEEMLTCYEFGFSISEKVFKKRDDGKLSLKFIKTRHPGPWLIHQDEAGNITRYEQQGTSHSVDIPPEVLIHMVNKRRFQNPYGTSDLQAAYQAWFAKKHITRWYSIFIEKAASPIPHGKYGSAADPAAVTKLYNILKQFQTKTTLVTPDYVDVNFIEAKSNGDAFIRGINLFNMFIGRSLLIPDLLGFQGSETSGGSYTLGAKQMEIFFKHISRRRALLEKIVNDEIVWPIVLHNFGYIDKYPRFKLRPISNEEIIQSSQLWLDAVKSRVYKPTDEEINHFKQIVNFPVTDENELEEPEISIYPTEDGDETAIDDQPRDDEQIEDPIEESDEAKRSYKYNPTSGAYAGKTNFQMIESQLVESLETFKTMSNVAVEEILEDLKDQIAKKRIVQKGDISKVDQLKVKKTKSLKNLLMRSLSELYKKSKTTASTEILKSGFAKPIVDESFLKLLDQETFQFIGDFEYQVTKEARIAMIQAIKDGEPLQKVIDVIDVQTKAFAATSLERYARTKFTEVMNKGRVAFFDQSKVVAGYQFSAILDDRVTEICRGLHGKKFKDGDQPIPPMHFNCRSVLVPITIFEEFEPDSKVGKMNIDDFIEEKKGVGFPKQ